jgi:peptidoglycan/LPS O-acetylase OafA/YrhL
VSHTSPGAREQVPPTQAADDEVAPVHDLPPLDSMRGLAALAVVATHVGFWTGTYSFDFFGTAVARLDLGVSVFFVLSGFLLSRPFLPGRAQPALANYYWKRALRVLPAYWLVVVIALLTLTENRGTGLLGWVRALTLTDLYTEEKLPAGVTQMWSLATEIAFYALLPLIMVVWRLLTRGERAAWGIYALIVLSGTCTVLWFNLSDDLVGDGSTLHLQWLPASLIWFALGIALAHVHDLSHAAQSGPGAGRPASLGWVVKLGRQPGVCWTLAAAAFVAAATPLAGPPIFAPPTPAQSITRTFLYAAFSALVVASAVFAPRTSAFRAWASHRWLRHLGDISFGIFCVHVLVLHFLGRFTPWAPFTESDHFWAVFLATTAISIVLAEVIYRVVERPLMRFRGVGTRRPATSSKASSASGTTISS